MASSLILILTHVLYIGSAMAYTVSGSDKDVQGTLYNHLGGLQPIKDKMGSSGPDKMTSSEPIIDEKRSSEPIEDAKSRVSSFESSDHLIMDKNSTVALWNSLRSSEPILVDQESTIGQDTVSSNYAEMLPIGQPVELALDKPGKPLTPAEFNFELTQEDETEFLPANIIEGDPIELADAFEGDIRLANLEELQQMIGPFQARNSIRVPEKRWPNGVIPYVISSIYTEKERGIIASAMQAFHLKTCIKFVPRNNHKDYIHLFKGKGCSSNVGKAGGSQAVSLGRGCVYPGIVMHELMHAVGFWHEQSRWDRDDYLDINWDNIDLSKHLNFQKYDWSTIAHLEQAYDYGSIMHYGAKSFAKNHNITTIVPRIAGTRIGQREGFSGTDLKKINILYDCSNSGKEKINASYAPDVSACKDDDVRCAEWQVAGECEHNPLWMSLHCRVACKTCNYECKDRDKHCHFWANKPENECVKNPGYMLTACPLSCNICINPNDKASNDCMDKNAYCKPWGAAGYCHTHLEYMSVTCKKSCTTCDTTAS